MKIEIPDDLVADVADAIERKAAVYRDDVHHDPEDVETLQRDADRLDEIAAELSLYDARQRARTTKEQP